MHKHLTTLLVLFITHLAQAQHYEVPLAQRIDKAAAIIKGRVIAQKAYRNSKNEIYTANLIEVQAIFKGKAGTKVLVCTRGGTIGNSSETVEDGGIDLPLGHGGYFFLIPAIAEPIRDRKFQAKNMAIYAGPQGFIHLYPDFKTKALVAREPFHVYTDIQRELLDVIEQQTQVKPVYLGKKE